MVRIVLDTGVLFKKEALESLRSESIDIIIPAMAFIERCRQLMPKGVRPRDLLIDLHANDINVESMDWKQANRLPEIIQNDPNVWKRLSRDAIISLHVGEEDQLWTTNPNDFIELGIPQERIISC